METFRHGLWGPWSLSISGLCFILENSTLCFPANNTHIWPNTCSLPQPRDLGSQTGHGLWPRCHPYSGSSCCLWAEPWPCPRTHGSPRFKTAAHRSHRTQISPSWICPRKLTSFVFPGQLPAPFCLCKHHPHLSRGRQIHSPFLPGWWHLSASSWSFLPGWHVAKLHLHLQLPLAQGAQLPPQTRDVAFTFVIYITSSSHYFMHCRRPQLAF